MPAPNIDNGIQQDKKATQFPVMMSNFLDPSQLPIFWGPGQILDPSNYPTYQPPDTNKWPAMQPLYIPKVVRFISSTSSAYDTNGFPTPGGGGGGGATNFWKILNVVPHDPAYGGSFMIYVGFFHNTSQTIPTSTGAFSINPVVTGSGPSYSPTYVGGEYVVGLSWSPIYPDGSPFAVDYLILGTSGPGFYYRYTGHLAVPNH